MKLIVDDVDEHNPNDISYVYSGYAPISVRLIQCACLLSNSKSMPLPSNTSSLFNPTSILSTTNTNTNNSEANNSSSSYNNNNNSNSSSSNVSWRGWDEVLRYLPGPTFEEEQSVPNNSIYFNKSIYIYIYYIL